MRKNRRASSRKRRSYRRDVKRSKRRQRFNPLIPPRLVYSMLSGAGGRG
jgi:hypothetical protein